MPNTENIDKLIRALKEEDLVYGGKSVHFNMNMWLEQLSCGTKACMGGHCEIIMRQEGAQRFFTSDVGEWLGLDENEIHELFFNWEGEVDNARAIRVLENLKTTGNVDWMIE